MAPGNLHADNLTRIDAVPSRMGVASPSSRPVSRWPHRSHSNGAIRRWNVNGQWENTSPDDNEKQTMFQFVNTDGLPEPNIAKSKQALSQVRSHAMRNYLLKQKLHKAKAISVAATEDIVGSFSASLDIALDGKGRNFGVSHAPYMLVMGEDALDAPVLRISYSAWPFPRPSASPGPLVSICMPQSTIPVPNSSLSDNETLLRISHVPWIVGRAEYYQYKGELVDWINHRLDDKIKGISDETIGVIMSLIMWEMERNWPSRPAGSNQREMIRANISELKAHMHGLKKIIELRGGLQNIQTANYFPMKLLGIDLVVAVITNDMPVFLRTNFHGPTEPQSYLSDPTLRPILDSPLHGSKSLFIVFTSTILGADSIMLLQHLREMTEVAIAGTEVPRVSGGSSNAHNPSPHSPSSGVTNDCSLDIHKVVLLTSTIYQRALQWPPVPFSSPYNRSTVKLLHLAIMRQAQHPVWGCLPGLTTWVLLTGLAAAIDMPERTSFVIFLANTALSAMRGWWDVFTLSILRFKQVQRRAES